MGNEKYLYAMKFSCRALFSVDFSNWIDRKSLMGERCEERDSCSLKLKIPILSSKLLNKSDLWLKHIRNIKVWGLVVAVLFILQPSGWEIGQTFYFVFFHHCFSGLRQGRFFKK